MVTPAAFKSMFPEFGKSTDAYIQSWLDLANRHIGRTVWGAKADDGQLFLAAHLMATSPSGQNAKLSKADGTSTYGHQFNRLKNEVTGGYRVAVTT